MMLLKPVEMTCVCGCGEKFLKISSRQKYIDYSHYLAYHRNLYKLDQFKSLISRTMRLKKLKTREYQAEVFWKMMGDQSQCCFCFKTEKTNFEEIGKHMFVQLIPGKYDIDIVDPDNWNFFCYECYLKVFGTQPSNEQEQIK